MLESLVVTDNSVEYQTKEAAVIVAAAAFVIALGGIAAAAVVICGWRGTRSIVMDWIKGRATFVCR